MHTNLIKKYPPSLNRHLTQENAQMVNNCVHRLHVWGFSDLSSSELPQNTSKNGSDTECWLKHGTATAPSHAGNTPHYSHVGRAGGVILVRA